MTKADVQGTFQSSAAAAEIPIGADDLDGLDQGESRRRRVEELRVDQGPGAVLGLVESLADSDWRVRRSAATALAGESGVDASALLGDLLYSDDAGERNAAIKALIKRNSESIRILVRELGSEVPDVRNFSALALGQIGDSSALEHLIPMLETEQDENVLHMVIEALGRIAHEDAVEPLLRILEHGTFSSVAAAEALGSIASLRAVVPLTAVLGDDPIGAASAEALGRIGDVRALAPLVHSMDGASPMYGACVVRAMAGIVSHPEMAVEPVLAVLRAWLRVDSPVELRDSVARCLATDGPDRVAGMHVAVWLREPALTPHVCQAAQTPELIDHAARFLAEDIESVRSHLEAAARSAYPAVRSVLARALGKVGDSRDIPMLVRLVADENLSVRIDAIAALSARDAVGQHEVFLGLLSDEFEEVRAAAADALASVGHEAADELTSLAEEGDESVRDAVARALARTTWSGYADKLWDVALTLARDPSPAVRRRVTPALGTMPGHEALSVLLTLALDEDHYLRVTAIRTLALRSEDTARRALRQALEEGSTSITIAALRGLALDPECEDVALMSSLLHSSDPGVIVAALGGLARCGSSDDASAVVQLVKHAVSDVREAALRTLIALSPRVACDVAALVLGGSEPSWHVRLAATAALECCDAPEVRALVEQLLEDDEILVRQKAVRVVPGAYGSDAVACLLTLLGAPELSDDAIECLVALGPEVVPELAERALDLPLGVRRLVSVVLGRIACPEAIEHLLASYGSDDVEHRWAAALGLSLSSAATHAERIGRLRAEESDESIRAALTAAIDVLVVDGGDAS